MSADQVAAAAPAPNAPAPAEAEGPRIVTVLGQDEFKPAPAPEVEAAKPAEAAAAGSEESAEGSEANTERDDKGRFKKPGVQQRIDELTRARHDAEREAAYWKGLAAGKGGEQAAPATPAAPAELQQPVRSAFATDEEFQEAMVDYKVDLKLQQRDTQRQQVETATARATSWQEKINAAKAEIPDYDTVMDNANMPVAPHVAELLMEHDLGAKVVHFLASNPAMLEKMNGMTPAKAAFEVAAIASKFQTAAAASGTEAAPASAAAAEVQQGASSKPAAERAVSKAPPPAASNVGAGRATTPNLGDLPMDEYVAQRKAQGASWAR